MAAAPRDAEALYGRSALRRCSGTDRMSSSNPGASPTSASRRLPLHWLGVVPFAVFVLLFLLLPTLKIVLGAFQTPDGGFTLENIAGLFTPSIIGAYWISIKISVASALLGCAIGFAVAAAVVLGGLPGWIR